MLACQQHGVHVVQEDLAAAEAELAGWYETMQRETTALKRIYSGPDQDAPDSPHGARPSEHKGPAKTGSPEGPSTSGQDPGNADGRRSAASKNVSHKRQSPEKVFARQLPQVMSHTLLGADQCSIRC